MKRVVFYSWQRDLPNPTNRGLIEAALELAAKAIRNDDSIEVDPVIDRDVAGTGGSSDIAKTIFGKIDSADVVVCDVSCIGTAGKRPVPNPNVLVELGYAVRAKGWERVIMVSNGAFGEVESLPFDLRTRFVIQYHAEEADTDRATPRKKLASQLEAQLRFILSSIEEPEQTFDLTTKVVEQIEAGQTASLRATVLKCGKEVVTQLTGDRFQMNEKGDREVLLKRIEDYEAICFDLAKVVAHGCYYDTNPGLWIEVIDLVANAYSEQKYWSGTNWWLELKMYPPLLLLHAGGTAAVAAEKYDMLAALLSKLKYHEYGNKEKPLSQEIFAFQSESRGLFNHAQETKHYTPISDRVARVLRPALDELIPQQQRYEAAFDRFEYLASLYSFGLGDDVLGRPWGPMGSFMWRRRNDKSLKIELEREVREHGNNSPLVKARLVNGDGAAFYDTLNEFEKFVNQCRIQSHCF